MSIGRISGPLLKANLLRDGVDLAFENDLLYLKVAPQTLGTDPNEDGDPNQNNPSLVLNPQRAIGIKTNNPLYDLHVQGTIYAELFLGQQLQIDNVNIDGNTIKSTLGDLNINPATSLDRVVIGPAIIEDIYGDTTLHDSLTVEGSVEIGNDIEVLGDSTFYGDINAQRNISAVGNITVGTSANYNSIQANAQGVSVQLAASAPITNGIGVRLSNTTGVTQINNNTTYYCYDYDSLTLRFKLATTEENAIQGIGILNATGTFTGTGIATIGGPSRFFNSVTVDQDLIVTGNLTFSNTGTFVTLDGTQTITNKTLTSPFINDGTVNLDGGNLILPLSTTPNQTQNGAVVWDSDTFLLTVGTGSSRKTLVDTDSTQALSNKSFVNLNITGTTDSSSTTTGVLTVAGGVGIAKKLYVGNNLQVNQDATVSGQLTVGVNIKFSTYAAIEYNVANDSIDFIFY